MYILAVVMWATEEELGQVVFHEFRSRPAAEAALEWFRLQGIKATIFDDFDGE